MNKEPIQSFEDLECWKACREVRQFVSGLTKTFPPYERESLIDGMRKSSRSVTENIAEGYGSFNFRNNLMHCRTSRSSLYELMDQFVTALDEGYISYKDYAKGREMLENSKALLNAYIKYLAQPNLAVTNQ